MSSNKLLLVLGLALTTAACSASPTDASLPDGDVERGPIGKADGMGSCFDGDDDFCGEQSDGACWCDDLCASYGDCCDDKAAACDAPPPAGCLASSECGVGEYCSFASGCGEGAVGSCEAQPAVCLAVVDPVCGCDGVTYGNACDAAAEGVSVQHDGTCAPAADSCEGACDEQAAAGCWCDAACASYGDCCPDKAEICDAPPVELTCEEIVQAYQTATAEIRSCEDASDCGQVLAGTSCGCTRNWVARTDADLEEWEALRNLANEQGCSLGGISTCDCPATAGFACQAGTCTWNYL